jgi:hypothetical protein
VVLEMVGCGGVVVSDFVAIALVPRANQIRKHDKVSLKSQVEQQCKRKITRSCGLSSAAGTNTVIYLGYDR